MAEGEEVRRAQSKGEWPGVRRTFFRGLVGIAECVGGGANENEDFVGVRLGSWIGERMGGDIRPAVPWGLSVGRAPSRGGAPVPPEALCAEFRAGKEGGGARFEEVRCAEFREGKGGADEERVKVGTVGVLSSSPKIVGGEGCFGPGFLNGGGGGGIAFLSISSLLMFIDGISTLFMVGDASFAVLGPSRRDIEGGASGCSFFAASWRVWRCSQVRNDQEEGGCR